MQPLRHPITDPGGAETRDRLLDAAEELFAERGFDGASVREITQRAESNVAAVNYYFGGKSNLYHAVFERRLAALRARRLEAIASARRERQDLEGLLRTFALAFLEPFTGAEGCRWVRLYSREMLDPRLPAGIFFDQVIGPTQQALAEAFAAVSPGLDEETARRSVQSVVGQLLHVRHLCDYTDSAGCGGRLPNLDADRLVEHVVRFSAAAIRDLSSVS